ncbi:MAG: SRPBCC domain-containing protein [Gaiellaceae bacterium]
MASDQRARGAAALVPPVPNWELKPGARFTNEEGQGEGQITEVNAPTVLAYRWGAEQFRFELPPHGDGCLLIFTHVFDDRALAAQHAAGWEVYFNRLDTHLAGGFLAEETAHEAASELHERYAEIFGLDPGLDGGHWQHLTNE